MVCLIFRHILLGFEQGEMVAMELLKPIEEIRQAIVFNGSHDLTIDLLSSHLKKINNQYENYFIPCRQYGRVNGN